MAVWSIVKYSELGLNKRIDAQFYRPEYLDSIDNIENWDNSPLRDLALITDGEHGSPDLTDDGHICLSSNNVSNFQIKIDDSVKKVSEEQFRKNKRVLLKKGNILLSIVGTIGKAALVQEDIDGITDRNAATIIVNDRNQIEPFYLTAFLNSAFGNVQTNALSTGNVQPLLNLIQVGNIRVPIIDFSIQKGIAEIVKNGLSLFNSSRSLLASAEGMLLAELGLEGLELPKTKWNIRNFSEARTEERIDGEYYLPKYYALIEAINNSKYGGALILEKARHKTSKIRPKEDKNYKYIELADIDQSLGTVGELEEIPGDELPSRARMALKARNVVISSVEGSVDKVALIPEDLDGAVGSTGFFVFEEREYTAELLLVLLRSKLLKDQFLREARGTILTAVNQGSLANIIVPEVPEPLMNEISAKVRESHSARAEAKRLLEDAKRTVEEIILEP